LIVRKYNLNIDAVLDKKFTKKVIYNGFIAYPLNQYLPNEKEKEDLLVVITIGKSEYHEEVLEFLKGLGMKNIIFAKDIYEFNLPYMPVELKQKGFRFYLDNKEKILSCFEIFQDDISCEIYTLFIKTHMLKKVFSIPYRPVEEQYFPNDVPLTKGYENFVHCGAFDGSTIKYLNKKIGKIRKLVCFEPNLDNFSLLTGCLSEAKNKIAEDIFCYPCGVYDKEKQISFRKSMHTSHIEEKGDSFIICAALDNLLPKFRSTFISMDIEGAELEALKGAEKTIRENIPDLGISVYHLPNHIWEIPLYLEQLKIGYNFFLRNYSGFAIETILYATV